MKKLTLIAGWSSLCLLLPALQAQAQSVIIKREEILVAQDSRYGEAMRLISQANQLLSEGSSNSQLQAIEVYKNALLILENLNKRETQAVVLGNIGYIYSNYIGEKQQALDYYEQALFIQREVNNRVGEAATLNNIGSVYNSIGEKQKALDYFEQAVSIQREVNDRAGEANTLNNIGGLYYSIGEKQKVLDYYEQALSIQREVNDRAGEATALNNLGSVYNFIGEKQKALDYFEQALSIRREVNDRAGEAATLNNIGLVYSSVGEKQKALDYFEQALSIRREVNSRAGEAATLSNIGSVYDSIGEKKEALNYYEQALSIQREVNDRAGEATTLSNIGSVYNSIGEKQKALDYYERQTLPILREVNDRAGEATTLSNIGSVYDFIGEKQEALDYYEQALSIRREVNDKPGEAVTLNNIGLVYSSIGEKQEALDYYEQALSIRREVNDKPGEAVTLNNIGLVYSSIGEKQEALDYYEQALSIQREVNDRAGEATALNNLGSVYNFIGEKQKALDYYEQALSIRREVNDKPGEATTLNNLGWVYDSMGEKQKALDYYERALPISREVSDPATEAITLFNIAALKKEQNDLPKALENINLAIALIEDLRTNIVSDNLRVSYFSTVQDYYQLKTDILMQLEQPEAAFDSSEDARARSLIELLRESNVDIRKGVPLNLLEQETSLQQELQEIEQKRIVLSSSEHTFEQAEALDRESDYILQQLDQAIAQIRQVSPAYAETVKPQPLLLQQIQKRILDEDTVLLQYSLGAEQSYLWIVGKNIFQTYTLPGRTEIEPIADQFRSATTTDTPTSDVYRKGKELAELILPEIPGWATDKRLLISGEGVLAELPFHALPLPKKDTYTPLLVEHEVLTQPSISSVGIIRQEFSERPLRPPAIAILADPVYRADDDRITGQTAIESVFPSSLSDTERNLRDLDLRNIQRLKYTRPEADAILAAASDLKTIAAFDFDATYEWVTNAALSEYSIVHLATHGFINPVNPQLSGIVLNLVNPEGQLRDNGFLRLHDIFNLSLNAELVVLSACQTGLGKNVSGEGIVGLSRGFMYAGAERIMVSLWNVNDESTAALMSTFYRYLLNDNLSPAAALRAAQKEQWEAGEIPYKWAAFTLQGEWQ